MATTALSLFPQNIKIADANGFATQEFFRALAALFIRVGGALGDVGIDVHAPLVLGDIEVALIAQPGAPDAIAEMVTQPSVVQAFPIGGVFISTVATDPAILLGYGTWTAIGAGQVLIGQDTGDADFDVLGETGGAKTKPISAHSVTTANFTTTGSPAVTSIANHADLNVVQPYLVVKIWQRTA